MGRPPAEKPRNVQIAFRVDEETAARIDAELAADRKPGDVLSRNDIARRLMYEALEARRQQRHGKKK